MSNDIRATTRRLAGRAYRGIRTGRDRVLKFVAAGLAAGPDGTIPPTPPASAPPPAPADAAAPPTEVFTTPPWEPLAASDAAVVCNICRWTGDGFVKPGHCEMSTCPSCGSIGRDRFLHWSFTHRADLHTALRVIECSPRLGPAYRSAMQTWFFYRTSDYDLRAHEGNLQLDLQAIDLPDDSLDVMLCAHVLEHVPDTDKALAELRRVIAPGGRLVLQVPILQARTAPPTEPEFHGDNTPVFWRFGFDLTARLREHGFTTDLLCTQDFLDAVEQGTKPWTEWHGEFDVPDMLAGAIREDLVVAADDEQATRLGITPGYMYLTWDCRVPPA